MLGVCTLYFKRGIKHPGMQRAMAHPIPMTRLTPECLCGSNVFGKGFETTGAIGCRASVEHFFSTFKCTTSSAETQLKLKTNTPLILKLNEGKDKFIGSRISLQGEFRVTLTMHVKFIDT